MNNKINRIHEKALRLVYFNYSFNFNELLKQDGSFSIHNKNSYWDMQVFFVVQKHF